MRPTLPWLSCCENMSLRQSSYSKCFSLHIFLTTLLKYLLNSSAMISESSRTVPLMFSIWHSSLPLDLSLTNGFMVFRDFLGSSLWILLQFVLKYVCLGTEPICTFFVTPTAEGIFFSRAGCIFQLPAGGSVQRYAANCLILTNQLGFFVFWLDGSWHPPSPFFFQSTRK